MNFNRIFNKIHTQPAAVGQSGSSAPSTGKKTSAILLMNIAASVVLPLVKSIKIHKLNNTIDFPILSQILPKLLFV